jgi:GDP-L-fucose synthase
MKIIIFGSTGLVGSSLVRTFKNTQYEIFVPKRKEVDLFSNTETKKYISDISPDIIINAAAKVGGIVANDRYRTDFIIQNLKINMNILESCIPFPNIKIINLGSSCIYPLNAPNPISESEIMNGKLEPTNSPYAMAKLASIEMGDAMSKEYGHQVINLMPTNLYGPNDNFSETDSHVIPGLISRMHQEAFLKSNTFNIWGTGKPLREFLYSDDLADAIKFILENNVKDPLINIGSGEEISIKEVAFIIKDVIGFQGELVFDTSKPDGNPRKLLDSNLISSYGWSPKTKINRGINNTYEWFVNNIK